MLHLTGLAPDDFAAFGALVFLVVVAKFTRSETRSLMAGLIAVVLVPVPAALIVVGLLSMVWAFVDWVRSFT